MGTPFKINGELQLMTVSQRQMAAALKLSPTRINQLITEGILVRDDSTAQGRLMLIESLQNYYLSRNTPAEGADFWKERSLHEKAKRELAELKLERERGELYWAQDVETFLTEMIIECKSKFLGVGHKLAPQLEGLKSAQICVRIDREINDILTELAENAKEREFSKDDEELESAAADDG